MNISESPDDHARAEAGAPSALMLDSPLTRRQAEILSLVADDLTDAQVATRLGLSATTVRTHMKNIRERLEVNSRAGAVGRALREGLFR